MRRPPLTSANCVARGWYIPGPQQIGLGLALDDQDPRPALGLTSPGRTIRMPSPEALSGTLADSASRAALHDLRGSHETALLDAGVPVHVVAERLRNYAKRSRLAGTIPLRSAVGGSYLHRIERLTGFAADSPLVIQRGSANQLTYGLGASYSFNMHPWW
jgi:hypothetical protein